MNSAQPNCKVQITKAQKKEFERLLGDFRFQDEFIQKSLVQLQRRKDPVRFGRLHKLWDDSKKAAALYAEQGNIEGFRRVIENNQRFIDSILAGKIKLFDVESQ